MKSTVSSVPAPTDGATIRVLLADDHPVVREGVRSCLADQVDIAIVGEASNGRLALEKARELLPDVLLLDIHLPDLNGIEVARMLQEEPIHGDCRILLLTTYNERQFVLSAIRLGVAGYILKDTGPRELAEAIRTVHDGGRYFDPKVGGLLAGNRAGGLPSESAGAEAQLSKREIEVLGLIAREHSNKEIADRLGVSVRTIESHRERLMQKLEIHNVVGLTRYAIATGIAPLE